MGTVNLETCTIAKSHDRLCLVNDELIIGYSGAYKHLYKKNNNGTWNIISSTKVRYEGSL